MDNFIGTVSKAVPKVQIKALRPRFGSSIKGAIDSFFEADDVRNPKDDDYADGAKEPDAKRQQLEKLSAVL